MYDEERTVFGRSFLDGLLGGADRPDAGGNDDGFVALDELFPFVVEQCRTRTAGEQTPLLMHCGQPLEALTRIPPDMRLARNPSPAKKEEPAAEASADGKAKTTGTGFYGGGKDSARRETGARYWGR